MMNFRSINVNDFQLYNEFKGGKKICGCEMSFANLFLWGDQKLYNDENALYFLSTFSRSFYPFPFKGGQSYFTTMFSSLLGTAITFTIFLPSVSPLTFSSSIAIFSISSFDKSPGMLIFSLILPLI